MTTDQQPHAYKPIMAGLFTGIIATLLNMIFDVFYRQATGFELSAIINVASIIFGTLLILLFAGALFALLDRFINHVTIPYIILFVLLAVAGIYSTMHVVRTDNPIETSHFRGLLLGIIIISSIGALFIPYLSKHDTDII